MKAMVNALPLINKFFHVQFNLPVNSICFNTLLAKVS